MDDSHYCNAFPSCPVRLDLENTRNKLAFLKDNWGDLEAPEKVNNLSMKDLKCAACLTRIVLSALVKKKYFCSYRDIIRIITIQTYILNAYEIRKLELRLRQEIREELQEKLEKQQSDSQ